MLSLGPGLLSETVVIAFPLFLVKPPMHPKARTTEAGMNSERMGYFFSSLCYQVSLQEITVSEPPCGPSVTQTKPASSNQTGVCAQMLINPQSRFLSINHISRLFVTYSSKDRNRVTSRPIVLF